MVIPTTIFKYEPFSTQSLLNLKSQSVYFGSPRNFNDPYDCAITATVGEPTKEELQKALEHYFSAADIPPEMKTAMAKMPPEEMKAQLFRGATQALAVARDNFLTDNGVTCFSETNHDLLMWSHYGGQYRGFCLELRTNYEPFDNIRPVKYVKHMPEIRLPSIISLDDSDQFIDLYCTKSESWAYEREWRGIHKVAETLFTYPPESLKAVYFGPDMEEQTLEIICLILAGQNPHVELWCGTRSATEFKVEFEPFTYTSHIEAKRQGLA
jgi:hypothetical protein